MRLFCAVVLLMLTLACSKQPEPVALSTSEQSVEVITSSPAVDARMLAEGKREEEVRASKAAETGADAELRIKNLSAIAAAGIVEVPGGAKGVLLEKSLCFCDPHPDYSLRMVKVRVTAPGGHTTVGWVCETKLRYLNQAP